MLSIINELENISCHDYVDDLCYECNGISDLDDYIDYNMLSKSLKELIPKDNFVFSTTEEKYHFCNLIMNLDYNYNHNSNVYSTNVAVNAICECANVNVNFTRDFMGRHGKSGDIIILMGNFRGILHNKCDPIIIEGNLSI